MSASTNSNGGVGETPFDMTALFSVLQGYSSTSEVRYLIDEAVRVFAEKRLPLLVSGIVGNAEISSATNRDAANGAAGTNSTATAAPPFAATSGGVDADWLAVVIRAKIETDLEEQIKRAVHEEVARQIAELVPTQHSSRLSVVRRTDGGARARSSASAPSLPPLPPTSPPPKGERDRGDTTSNNHASDMCKEDTKMDTDEGGCTSPPPPGLFQGLREDSEDDVDDDNEETEAEEGSDTTSNLETAHKAGQRSIAVAATSSPREAEDAAETGRRQRERILSAIRDVEHQLSSVQRQANELAHQQRLSQQRMATLLAAAHSVGNAATTTTSAAKAESSPGGRGNGELVSAPASLNTSRASGTTNASTLYATMLSALDTRELPRVRQLAREVMLALMLPTVTEATPTPAAPASAMAAVSALSSPGPQHAGPHTPVADASLQASTATPNENYHRRYDGSGIPGTALNGSRTISGGRNGDRACIAAGGSMRAGDVVPPPPPALQTSHHAQSIAARTSEAAAAQLFAAAAGSAGYGGRLTTRTPTGAPSASVTHAAQQLEKLVESGSGQRSRTVQGTPRTPPTPSWNASASAHTSFAAEDSPPPITARQGGLLGPFPTAPSPVASPTPSRESGRTAQMAAPQHQQPPHVFVTAATGTAAVATLPSSSPATAPASTAPLRAYVYSTTAPHHHRHSHHRSCTASPLPHSSPSQRQQQQQQQSKRPDITLGVDAIDLPVGVLPSALGLRGGVRVLAVGRGQLAERSGIAAGDVVLAVGEVAVETCAQLQQGIRESGPGPIRVDVYRHIANLIFTVTLDT